MRRGPMLAAIVLGLGDAVIGRALAADAPTAPPSPAGGGQVAARFEGETAAAWSDRLESPDPALRRKAAWALWNLGSAADIAGARLAGALSDVDPYVRDVASRTLERLKEAAGAAVPRVGALLGHEREEVRHAAATLLVRWGALAVRVAPALVSALESEDPKVRELAAAALGHCGPAGRAALPRLGALLDDDFPDVRVAAASALARIDVLAALPHEHREVRIEALRQLNGGNSFHLLPDVREALRPLLRDDDREVRAGAAVVMSNALLARDAATWRTAWVRTFLEVAHSEGSSYVRRNMTFALARLPEARAESVPILLGWSHSADAELRAAAVLAFRELGDPEGVAKPRVLEAMRDPDGGVRRNGAMALPVVAKDDPRVVPALATMLSDSDRLAAVSAAESLGALGGASAAAVPDLVRCLDPSRRLALRIAAANALRQVGSPARDAAVPVLERWIADDPSAPIAFSDALLHLDGRPRSDAAARIVAAALGNDDVGRNIAGAALRHAAERSDLLLPGLLSALKEGDSTRRERALRALARFEPVPPAARAAIRDASSDPDPAVATAARDALDAMGG